MFGFQSYNRYTKKICFNRSSLPRPHPLSLPTLTTTRNPHQTLPQPPTHNIWHWNSHYLPSQITFPLSHTTSHSRHLTLVSASIHTTPTSPPTHTTCHSPLTPPQLTMTGGLHLPTVSCPPLPWPPFPLPHRHWSVASVTNSYERKANLHYKYMRDNVVQTRSHPGRTCKRAERAKRWQSPTEDDLHFLFGLLLPVSITQPG